MSRTIPPPMPVMAPRITQSTEPRRWARAVAAPVTENSAKPAASSVSTWGCSRSIADCAMVVSRPAAPATARYRQSRNVAGGVPINRSRIVPPAMPTTTASTTAPKMSSLTRTPAMPPLRPNTNVPTRLRTSRKVGSNPRSRGGSTVRSIPPLCGEPGAAGRDERLHAGLERGVDDWCEPGIVVGRQLTQPAFSLGPVVGVGVDPADEREHGGDTPFDYEGAEVLAGCGWPGVPHTVLPELCMERVANPLGGRVVVAHEVVAVERGDLGRPRRTRGFGLRVDDPLDRVEHVLADVLVEGADVELDHRLIGDYVLLRA